METLIEFGRSFAPFAIECSVKISIAALAALLATQLLGRHRASQAFAFILTAFALGAFLLCSQGQHRTNNPTIDWSPTEIQHSSAFPSEVDVPISTAGPGLVAKYGSMFQIRFSGHSPSEAPGQALLSNPSRGVLGGWIGILGLVWFLGFAAISIHHLFGICVVKASLTTSTPCLDRRLLLIAASAREALDAGRVELRLSRTSRIAFLVGLFRPRIILPEEALKWSDDRVTSTLLHEFMHVKRFDIPIAEGIHLLTSLAWFSPLPWLAFKWALRFREEACDDAVVRAGVTPMCYAANLLETARSLSRSTRISTSAAISGGSLLAQRIKAVLEGPVARSRRDRILRNASAALMLSVGIGTAPFTAPLYSITDFGPAETLPQGPWEWIAASDPLTSPRGSISMRGAFSITQDGAYTRIRLTMDGQVTTFRLPSVALPGSIPLTARARMILPFGDLVDACSNRPFLNPGWTIWDDREVAVKSAGAGRVVVSRFDSRNGLIVEVDHGSGLRTRYGFGRHGSCAVRPGEFVTAGTPLGTCGDVSPYDIPSLNFAVLVQVCGRLVALDPAPFLFVSRENRETPLSASVLNASIRIEDRSQIRRFITCGVSVNGLSADGTLPLEWMILTQNLAIGEDLLAAGANPRAVTWDTHQAHIALHGPTITDIAKETANPALIALLAPHVDSLWHDRTLD